ncbi:hypothetical protein ACJX0J_014643 [Zea mays]
MRIVGAWDGGMFEGVVFRNHAYLVVSFLYSTGVVFPNNLGATPKEKIESEALGPHLDGHFKSDTVIEKINELSNLLEAKIQEEEDTFMDIVIQKTKKFRTDGGITKTLMAFLVPFMEKMNLGYQNLLLFMFAGMFWAMWSYRFYPLFTGGAMEITQKLTNYFIFCSLGWNLLSKFKSQIN